jgi:hypothetical protein
VNKVLSFDDRANKSHLVCKYLPCLATQLRGITWTEGYKPDEAPVVSCSYRHNKVVNTVWAGLLIRRFWVQVPGGALYVTR